MQLSSGEREWLKQKDQNKRLNCHTFAWMNFSFTDIESAWLGLLIKISCGLSDLYRLHRQKITRVLATPIKRRIIYFCRVETIQFQSLLEILYPAGTRSSWKALLDCNSSSHTELAKVLPRDWNKLITEGSHTLTSSVRDRTCNSNQHKNKRCTNEHIVQTLSPNGSLSICKKLLLLFFFCQKKKKRYHENH